MKLPKHFIIGCALMLCGIPVLFTKEEDIEDVRHDDNRP